MSYFSPKLKNGAKISSASDLKFRNFSEAPLVNFSNAQYRETPQKMGQK